MIIPGISTASMLEENRQADFVELTDVLDNTWKGIRNVVNIEKNELYKGLKVGLYFLMLPGIPVVCCVTDVTQKTGRYLNRISFINECFFKPSDDIKESWVVFEDEKKRCLNLKQVRNSIISALVLLLCMVPLQGRKTSYICR